MGYTYNLVEKPWIPCLTLAGTTVHVGLRDLFRRTHDLREIRSESPLETLALYRLVLAILHRTHGPRNLDEWSQLWRDGQGNWDIGRLDEYLDRWSDRFDLFSTDYPFYQVPGFDCSRPFPVAKLSHELASGNNPTLFDHSTDSDKVEVTAAATARALVAHQTFALSSGKSSTGHTTDGPLAGSVAVLLVGDSLFETLMLNLVRYDPQDHAPIAALDTDKPAWERDDPVRPGTKRFVVGYLDLLTWQSRAIRLIPHSDSPDPSDPNVAELYYGQGEGLDMSNTSDPQVPTTVTKKGIMRLRPRPDRAVWRDSTVLISLNQPDTKPSEACRWVSTLKQRGYVDSRLRVRLRAYGLANDQARIDLWREENIPLPLEYLDDPDLCADLRTELGKAESAGEALEKAIYVLALYLICPRADEPDAKYDRKAVRKFASQYKVSSHYWANLEVPFYSLAVDLVHDPSRATSEWSKAVQSQAWAALDVALDGVQRDARTLKAAVHARRVLGAGLARLFGR